MLCPNCEKEMKDMSYSYYGIGDWDSDYPSSFCEMFICKTCKIEYRNGLWKIPKNFEEPTLKQVMAIKIINNNLNTRYAPLIKSKCCKFIKDNIEKSKRISSNRFCCEKDLDDLYECCENNVWTEHY